MNFADGACDIKLSEINELLVSGWMMASCRIPHTSAQLTVNLCGNSPGNESYLVIPHCHFHAQKCTLVFM
jgi:hypothetical protein